MPSILLAAVVVLTVLVLFNLALTFAVIRRLRAHPHRVEAVAGPTPGTEAPSLRLTAVDGAAVDTDEIARTAALVAFMADGCKPCHDQLPALVSVAGSRISAGAAVLVVVLAPDGVPAEFVEAFAGLAPVVVQDGDAPVSSAFGVDGYPTYLEYDGGVVRGVHATVTDLPDLVRV